MEQEIGVTVVRVRPTCQQTRSWLWTSARALCIGAGRALYWNMARPQRRLPENAPGEFYVDESCIDCATCRIVAPSVFGSLARDLAYVHRQPETDAERTRALMALVSCPNVLESKNRAGLRRKRRLSVQRSSRLDRCSVRRR